METGDPTDVTSTLTELERKLVDLEQQLGMVAAGGPVPGLALQDAPPPTPAETHHAALRVEDLRGEIAELVRFRDQLEAAAKELVTEYDRLVSRLRAGAGESAEPSAEPAASARGIGGATRAPADEPAPSPVEEADVSAEPGLPAAVAAGMPGQTRPAAPAEAGNEYVGAVTIDAGPFTDIATLQAFEQALGRVEGATDVYVKSFEGNRALIDVRLSNPVHLVQQLHDQLALPIKASEAGNNRLTVDVETAAPDGT
jgi:hypothetical protein